MDVTSNPRGWSLATVASPVCNIGTHPRIRGSNIAPKPTHGATGHTYRDLFAEWDWSGWIEPQLDALASVGGNAVRLIGDFEGVNDGTYTQATYNARWSQLVAGAAARGMLTYPALGGVSQIASAGLSNATLTSTIVAICTHLETLKSNILGIDLIQESVRLRAQDDSYAFNLAPTLSPAVRAVTSIPITYSFSDNADRSSRFTTREWKTLLRTLVDYWDIHLYGATYRELPFDAFWSQGETLPVLIGEFGKAADAGTPAQAAFYQGVTDMTNYTPADIHLAGALSWTIFDQGAGANAWGMFDTDKTPRTALTGPFQTIPKI